MRQSGARRIVTVQGGTNSRSVRGDESPISLSAGSGAEAERSTIDKKEKGFSQKLSGKI